jgi:hypothetical protein
MRVFVAAASSEAERTRKVVAQLESAGIQVTLKAWAREGYEDAAKPLGLLPRREQAALDLGDVDFCQLFLMLLPSDGHTTAGAWVELGHAHHTGKFIVIVGHHPSVFVGLADEWHDDENAAIASLVKHAELRARDADL